LETAAKLPYLIDKDERTQAKTPLRALEYNLTVVFLQRVKFLFCTLSTSGHELIAESGTWDLLVIDEAARELRAGVAVALGALYGRVKGIVWAGDHQQGQSVIVGADSNVGYRLLSRNVFASLAESEKGGERPCEVELLNVCYRMEKALIAWSSSWLYDGKIVSDPNAGQSDMPLRNMLRAYWTRRLPADYTGPTTQIGLDVTDKTIKHEFLTGTTTRLNRGEARQIACTIIDMLMMDLPQSKGGEPYRRIRANDICIITNYTGQVLTIERAMKQRAAEVSVKQEDLEEL
jgi:hypothetical protein